MGWTIMLTWNALRNGQQLRSYITQTNTKWCAKNFCFKLRKRREEKRRAAEQSSNNNENNKSNNNN
jgi:hypothetical protein